MNAISRVFALGLLMVALLLPACSNKPDDLEFSLLFQTADNIKPEHPVVYNGFQIGEVVSVRLQNDGLVRVDLKIYGDHAGLMHREASFRIEKPGGAFSNSTERQISVKSTVGEIRTPIPQEDIIPVRNWLDNLTNQATRLWEDARDWANSKQGLELQRDLETFRKRSVELGKENWDEFRDNQYPKLERRAQELKQKLEDEGHTEKARQLWDDFQEVVRGKVGGE